MELYDDEDVSDAEDAWDILVRCETELRNICKRGCRGRYDLIEEMMGEVVDRVPAIYETWDPTMGTPLRAHVFINVKWYLWKWMNRRMKREVVCFEPMVEDPATVDARTVEIRDQVQSIRDELEDWEWEVLDLYFIEEMSFAEIAEELGLSRVVVRNRYMAALQHAQEIARERTDKSQG